MGVKGYNKTKGLAYRFNIILH